jgi:hypothetical protein
MRCFHDIRKWAVPIDVAIALAVFAALYSSATYSQHGSLANDAALSAVHWLVVLLLGTAKFKPDYVLPCDVEVTWLLYGVLFGQMELDAAPAFAAIVLSAYTFQIHKRKQRRDRSERETAALAAAATATSPRAVQDFA